jgi:hypothetical protein
LFTRASVRLGALALAMISAIILIGQFAVSRDLALPGDAIIGGDFAAFYAAGEAAARGLGANIYEPLAFEALLREVAPASDRYGLTWQYPPTYFFAVRPLAEIGYLPGYILWSGLTAAAWILALRSTGFRGLYLLVALAAPSAFHAAITGQNGFMTAALLAVAALHADRRPIIAGCAAALLTMKPQLGLLIPIAYLAGGCWRAFFVAAAGAAALAAASALVFGAETWIAFLDGAREASRNLAAGILPLYKMATPYAAARLAGVSESVSAALFIAVALSASVAVALVWRRTKDAELRAIALIGCALLAAPYGYYYELIILAAPMALLARRAAANGWLPGEPHLLALVFFLPLFLPGAPIREGFTLGPVVVILAAACALRRIGAEAPEIFRSASATFRLRRG